MNREPLCEQLPELPLRRLTALEELAVRRDYPGLLPLLGRYGLEGGDAAALAYGATLLARASGARHTPRQLLKRFSLGEIAALCEEYLAVRAGEVEYGCNESFGEADK